VILAADQRLSRARASSPPEDRGDDRAIALWLLGCCLMVLAIVVVGGITRLTESGLAIMEWAPLMGALPPLSEAEWQRVFDLYRSIPQYDAINAGMGLAEFRSIFWWEWTHRLLGRAIGAVFALPFLWFLVRRRIPKGMTPHLVALFLLGGLQGAIGWFMVASGFTQQVSVSQYRLVLHLGLALVIYGYMLWLAFGLLRPRPEPRDAAVAASLRRRLAALLVLAGLTIVFGGFVAGLDGGFLYNTFPLMNGRLLPGEFLATEPAWLDPFESPATAQLVHRWLAVALLLAVALVWAASRRQALPPSARQALNLMALMALVQVALGIGTLLLVVPIPLAAAHQAGAVILLGLLLWALHTVRAPKAAP
jgi:cytochrome c oxidase assembly protein subunit 15